MVGLKRGWLFVLMIDFYFCVLNYIRVVINIFVDLFGLYNLSEIDQKNYLEEIQKNILGMNLS